MSRTFHNKTWFFTVFLSFLGGVMVSLALSLPVHATSILDPNIPNCPSDLGDCMPNTLCHEDQGGFGFVYKCNNNGKFCPETCTVLSETEDYWTEMGAMERITYDQEYTLRCEQCGDNLCQFLEEVMSETAATSRSNPGCR